MPVYLCLPVFGYAVAPPASSFVTHLL